MKKISKKKIKELIKKYPYMHPNDDNYDYSYVGSIELPEGWTELFIQMCEDLEKPLKKAGLFDSFEFTQVKEKFGMLCCYFNVSGEIPQSVYEIIKKYAHISQYVCEICGKPANIQSTGWLMSFCRKCAAQANISDKVREINFEPFVTCYDTEDARIISCLDEWNRLFRFDKHIVFDDKKKYNFSAAVLPQWAWFDHYTWFIYVTKVSLKKLLAEHCGYNSQVYASEEEFEDKLKNLIHLLDQMDEMNYEQQAGEKSKDFFERRFYSMEKAKDKFFELYSKMFYDLWD